MDRKSGYLDYDGVEAGVVVATRRRRIWMGRAAVLAIRHLRYLRLPIWGDGIRFSDYGYPDIYAAIFVPYGHDDLAAYTGPGPFGRRHRKVPSLQQLCGDDSREIAGLPINSD